MNSLTEARDAGLDVRLDSGRLVIRGPQSQVKLAHQVLEQKGEIAALLTAEDEAVSWRAAAIRPQVPALGPVPFLVAREVMCVPGCCLSCGETLETSRSTRCPACSQAAWMVLRHSRDRMV